MASDARPRSPQDGARRRRDFTRSPYVTLGAVRYAVRRAPPPRACPCRCCSEEAVAACLGRAKPDRRTLERFQRNLGRSGREERPSRQKRLRDLTERLLRAHTTPPNTTPPPPPPPPLPPHSAPVLPPVPPPRSRHRHSPPRGVSVDRYDDFDHKITLVRVEPRSIVGSYAQKTIPYRSASFSQGDYAPDKYYKGFNRQPSIFDFGQRIFKTNTERAGISNASRDIETGSVTEENITEGGSVASVDSAVGSDEGLLSHASPAARSPPADALHKQLGSRSLTHPLPRRVPPVREETAAEASGSLPALMAPRVLHELREESDGSQADSAQAHSEGASPLEPAQPFAFPPLPDPPENACVNVDCECSNFSVDREDSIEKSIPVPVYECIVKQWSNKLPNDELQRSDATSDCSLDREKEDETITSEQVAHLLAAVQNPCTPAPLGARERRRTSDKSKRRKGIYITTASDDGGEEESSSVNGCKRENSDASLQEMRLSAETRTSSLLGDKSDDSCTNGPPSPCEGSTTIWPRSEDLRLRRARFSQQSSDERDEDSYRTRRKYGVISRGDSPSEAESDTCSRDRTASPSPYSPSDASDVEARRNQFSRTPFGKNLEAPTCRSVEVGRRSMSDATVPCRKSSSGAAPRIDVRTRGPTHVRATSSPSKLIGVKPGADLLAELLRGSSEALSNSSAFDNVVLTLHQHNMNEKKYFKWKLEELQKAIFDYRYNNMGLNESARIHKIPKATLKRYLDKDEPIYDINISKGRPTVFDEQLLVEHVLSLEEHMFGLTIKDVRKLAFQLAEKHSIPHNFNRVKQMAGKAWYYAFMGRHKDKISLRQPEATSLNRAKGFNRENVYEFFDLCKRKVDDNKLDATRIYNVDESGFQTVQKKTQKVVGAKGKKQVGALSSAERGVNTTMVACASAAGHYVPPMIIFKRMRMNEQLKDGAPPGSLVVVSESGYINSELFVQWLVHFINIVKPTKDLPVLLLLDGHTTHSKNINALELARQNGVIFLQLPGHTTHRLQPLDVSFFKPMSTYYSQAIESWLRTNPGKAVTQYQVCRLINEAYERAATIGNIANGYKAAGIWPVNSHVFQDHHFAPSEILTVASESAAISNEKFPKGNITQSNEQDSQMFEIQRNKDLTPSKVEKSKDFQVASTSGVNKKDIKCTLSPERQRQLNIAKLKASIQEISPLPKCTLSKKGRGIQKGVELTSSPYKNELEASQLKRRKRDKNTAKKPKLDFKLEHNYNKSKLNKGKGIGKKTKKKKASSDEETEMNTNVNMSETKQKKGKGIGKKSKNKEESSSGKTKVKQSRNEQKPKRNNNKGKRKKRKLSSDDETEDETVIVLNDESDSECDSNIEEKENQCTMCKKNYYDENGPLVDWVQCVRCHNWNHETCVQNPDICDSCFA